MFFFAFSKRKTKRETEAKDGTDACAKLTSVDNSGILLSLASSVVVSDETVDETLIVASLNILDELDAKFANRLIAVPETVAATKLPPLPPDVSDIVDNPTCDTFS